MPARMMMRMMTSYSLLEGKLLSFHIVLGLLGPLGHIGLARNMARPSLNL